MGLARIGAGAAACEYGSEYQELSQRRAELNDGFSAILSQLSEDDREFLLEYMDVADNLQYCFAQLAWRYGTLHR